MPDENFRVKNTLVVNSAFVANSTVVNAAAITATSVNATTLFVNGVNVNTVISGNASTAYTNAIAIAANATNLTSGTVAAARLPTSNTSQAGIVQLVDSVSCTSITAAATANSVKTVYDYATIIAATGTPPSGANTNIQFNNSGVFGGSAGLTFTSTSNTVAVGNTGSISVGNGSVNSVIGQGSITINGVNVNTAISGNAATAYTNAVTVSANADNITSGTLGMARLGANAVNTSAAFTITGVHTYTANIVVGNSTVNTQHSNATILISNSTSTTSIGLPDIRIGNSAAGNTVANTTAVTTGNSTVNTSVSFGTITISTGGTIATVNSTVYNGTANNAASFNGEPASFYTNATNLTTGTVNNSRLPAAINVTTVNAATLSVGSIVVANSQGLTTSANVNIAATGKLVIAPGAGIFANGGLGTAGQVLHSNGSSIYWDTDNDGVTSIATSNGLTGGTITTTGTVSILANTGIIANATGAYVNAAYIATIAANSATGSLNNTFTVGTASYFVANGNLGIGTATAGARLHVVGSEVRLQTTDAFYSIANTTGSRYGYLRGSSSGLLLASETAAANIIYLQTGASPDVSLVANGNLGVGITAPTTKLHVQGAILASDNITAFSDERLKENISTIDNALDLVNNIRGVRYNSKETGARRIGVVAQEIQPFVPEVVSQSGDYLSVAYGNIVGLLIEAIKELNAKVEDLENKVK